MPRLVSVVSLQRYAMLHDAAVGRWHRWTDEDARCPGENKKLSYRRGTLHWRSLQTTTFDRTYMAFY